MKFLPYPVGGSRSRALRQGSVAALVFAAAAIAADGDGESVGAVLRDPFWPIGYRPASTATASALSSGSPPQAAPTEEQWEAARRKVVVQGVTRRGDRAMAIINDRVIGVGEIVEAREGGFIFRWRVEAVEESGVIIRRWNYVPASPTGEGGRPVVPER
jgi:hypothetical protein